MLHVGLQLGPNFRCDTTGSQPGYNRTSEHVRNTSAIAKEPENTLCNAMHQAPAAPSRSRTNHVVMRADVHANPKMPSLVNPLDRRGRGSVVGCVEQLNRHDRLRREEKELSDRRCRGSRELRGRQLVGSTVRRGEAELKKVVYGNVYGGKVNEEHDLLERSEGMKVGMSRMMRKKADGTDLKKELVKLKGWVCCNGNASGEGSPD